MKIGINGFGRIGRQAFRAAFARSDVEVTHINDVADATQLATLLQFDTTYGRFGHRVRAEGADMIHIDGHTVTVSAETDPAVLAWGDRGVEGVLESTGMFRRREDAEAHVRAGAKKVLISAPGKTSLDGDFILGVNEDTYDPGRHHIISIGSCTTNCLAPVAKVLHEELGIRHGLMNTVHAYTPGQSLLDAPKKDIRRGRAAAENLVPSSTGAAAMIGRVIPDLDGKLRGIAVRAPVKCGSLLDLTCAVDKSASPEAVNDAMRAWSRERMAGILAVEEDPIVSSDVIGTGESAILSPQETDVIDERFVKVLAWYDNEWAYSQRCVDMMARMF